MKNNPQQLIVRDLELFFGFLLNGGYKIREFHYFPESFGNWEAQLESPNCLIIISSDRNAILLSFASLKANINYQIGIEPMIYFLSREERFIGNFEGNLFRGKKKQFERMANLLKEYIGQITPYFGDNFENHKNELLSAQNKYNRLSLEKHIQRIKE
jgi:hypothetical protein